MTDKEALEILNDPFLWQDFSESYECAEFAEALKRAVYALAEKVTKEEGECGQT